MQGPLTAGEQRYVVHVSHLTGHAFLFAKHSVQPFQVEVCQPLTDVVADCKAVPNDAHHEPNEAPVFDFVFQSLSYTVRRDAVIELTDITLSGVFAALRAALYHASDLLHSPCTATAWNTGTGPVVHATHQYRFHRPDAQPMNAGVREERNDFDLSPLPGALVIDLFDLRLCRHETIRVQHDKQPLSVLVDVCQHSPHTTAIFLSLAGKKYRFFDKCHAKHFVIEESNSFRNTNTSFLPAGPFESLPTRPRPLGMISVKGRGKACAMRRFKFVGKSRRAEMLEFEYDDVLFALKYSKPAFEPLFQLPPTLSTCHPEDELASGAVTLHDAQTVPYFVTLLKTALQSAGGCDPRSPGGDCARLTPHTGDAQRCSRPSTTTCRSRRRTASPRPSRRPSRHPH